MDQKAPPPASTRRTKRLDRPAPDADLRPIHPPINDSKQRAIGSRGTNYDAFWWVSAPQADAKPGAGHEYDQCDGVDQATSATAPAVYVGYCGLMRP